jgi:hypothetical protein
MTDVLALDVATTTRKRDQYVYALYAGRQLLPCYIGIGRAGRMHQHLQFARSGNLSRGNLRKCRTLRACCLRGIPIFACTLATQLTIDEACNLERLLIAIHGRRDLKTGCLLNASAGGSIGMRAFSPSTKARLAEAGRRHMARPEIRQMLAEKAHTPEARAKNSAAKKGTEPSAEARAKMADARRRRNDQFPEEMLWRNSFLHPPAKGSFKHSAETKGLIAEASRNQWKDSIIREQRSAFFRNPPPEIKAKIDAARFGRKTTLGKKWSLETRAKMSAAQKARYRRDFKRWQLPEKGDPSCVS